MLHRYLPAGEVAEHGPPVLLVPPLAAPAMAFDLRRGASFVQHLLAAGRRVYLVDYGPIRVEDADLGIVTAVASPFDISAVPLVAPLRPLAAIAGGGVSTAVRLLGGVPAPLTRWAFQLSGFDKYVMKPATVLAKLDDRDFLEQVEAVDHLMAKMNSYPGRLFGQLYHQLFRTNDLARGQLELDGRQVALADVKVPALLLAGDDDVLAPVRAVRRGAELLTGSPHVRFETAPGGHLGVLTGRRSRTTAWPQIDAFHQSFDAA